MSLAEVERLARMRPGSEYVASETAARDLIDEARAARKLLSRRGDEHPDVVARIGGTPGVPLRVRCAVPRGLVYVVLAANVPTPNLDDMRLANEVAKIVQLP